MCLNPESPIRPAASRHVFLLPVCERVSAGGGQAVIHSERRSVCDALKAFRPPPVVCRNLGDGIPFFFVPRDSSEFKGPVRRNTIVGRGLKS